MEINWPSPRTVKPTPKINVTIYSECKSIRNVVSSAEDSETCGAFDNRKITIGMGAALIVLDHKQPATPLKTDNSITEGFVNSGMKPKRSKTWDMKCY